MKKQRSSSTGTDTAAQPDPWGWFSTGLAPSWNTTWGSFDATKTTPYTYTFDTTTTGSGGLPWLSPGDWNLALGPEKAVMTFSTANKQARVTSQPDHESRRIVHGLVCRGHPVPLEVETGDLPEDTAAAIRTAFKDYEFCPDCQVYF